MLHSSSSRLVYVVDDDASVREGLSRLMDSAGFEVLACASVSEFLRRAQGSQRACVLLDLSAVRKCAADVRVVMHAVANLLPVIALADNGADETRRAREVGARFCLRKPADASALLDAIEWSMGSAP